jgi:hypothetical protein
MSTRQLIVRLVFPIAILLSFCVTKWSYADVVDAVDVVAYGFPLIHSMPAFHTSMATQYFVFEMAVDFAVYFAAVTLLVFGVNRLIPIHVSKLVSGILLSICGLILALFLAVVSGFDDDVYLYNDHQTEVLETGFTFSWKHVQRPDYDRYHPKNPSN